MLKVIDINGVWFKTEDFGRILCAAGWTLAMQTAGYYSIGTLDENTQSESNQKVQEASLPIILMNAAGSTLLPGLVSGINMAITGRNRFSTGFNCFMGLVVGSYLSKFKKATPMDVLLTTMVTTAGVASLATNIEGVARVIGYNQAGDRIANGINTVALASGLGMSWNFSSDLFSVAWGVMGSRFGLEVFEKTAELTAFTVTKLVAHFVGFEAFHV